MVVEVGVAAVRLRDPDDLGHGLSLGAELFLALAQQLRRTLALHHNTEGFGYDLQVSDIAILKGRRPRGRHREKGDRFGFYTQRHYYGRAHAIAAKWFRVPARVGLRIIHPKHSACCGG